MPFVNLSLLRQPFSGLEMQVKASRNPVWMQSGTLTSSKMLPRRKPLPLRGVESFPLKAWVSQPAGSGGPAVYTALGSCQVREAGMMIQRNRGAGTRLGMVVTACRVAEGPGFQAWLPQLPRQCRPTKLSPRPWFPLLASADVGPEPVIPPDAQLQS